MNLRRIIKEELEAEEFANLVRLFNSEDLDQKALAIQIAEANDVEKEFEEEFGVPLEKYKHFFYGIQEVIGNVSSELVKKYLRDEIGEDIIKNIKKKFKIS